MGLMQYINETRAELRHVAWPTRLQTIVYTVIVVALSVFIALYLGFFDFIFTTGLARTVAVLPHSNSGVTVTASTSEGTLIISTSTPAAPVKKPIPSTPGAPSFQ